MPLLAGLGPLGVPELLIIAFIVVLIFGVGRLPEVGGAVGKGIREFRKATKDGDEAPPVDSVSAPAADGAAAPSEAVAGTDTIFCGECGAKNARVSKFCSECGHALGAGVR